MILQLPRSNFILFMFLYIMKIVVAKNEQSYSINKCLIKQKQSTFFLMQWNTSTVSLLFFRLLHALKLHTIVITFFISILPVFSLHRTVNSISLLVLLKKKEKQNFGRYSYFSLYAKLHDNNKQQSKRFAMRKSWLRNTITKKTFRSNRSNRSDSAYKLWKFSLLLWIYMNT